MLRPFLRLSALFLLCLGTVLSSAHAQTLATAPVSRLSAGFERTQLVSLPGNTHPLAQPRYDVGAAPATMQAERLMLVLSRSAQQEAALQTYLQGVQDANSAQYHKFMTPEEFGQRFGVSDSDLAAVESWLSSQGFTVTRVAKSRMAIEFSGTVGQVQTAFHTSIHSFAAGGQQFWSNISDPQIPSGLARVVAGVSSLNSFKPRRTSVRSASAIVDPAKGTIKPSYTVGTSTQGYYIFVGPADAATIYDTPNALNPNNSGTTYDGTGVTIGIAGDSNIDITQVANYRATFGLAAKPVTVVVDGIDPGENGDAIEAYLDTEVATGLAPNASVVLYTAADTYYQSGLFLAIGRALDDNKVDILNVSFGACESAIGASSNQYIYALWEQAAAQGIAVTVSTGDSGSAGCDNPNTEYTASQGLAVNGLSSTPFNIAVGGTDFDALYATFPTSFTNYVNVTNSLANHRSALKYIPESPWNDSTYPNTTISANKPLSAYGDSNNIVAGGGGVSSVYTQPTWQSSFGSSSGRNQPDVSFLAGNGFYGATWALCTDLDSDSSGNPVTDCAGTPTTGNNFNLTGVGGTSAAAPAFAGMLALVQQKTGARLGQADYILYNLAHSKYATVYHDVTTGNNSVNCNAGTPNCVLQTLGFYFLSGYNTATGYDNASGLGSVDVKQMVSNWSSSSLASTTSALQLNGGTSAVSITHGQSVTVGATVSSSSGTPSGNVALVDSLNPASFPNNAAIGALTLSGGSASGTVKSLPGGSYQVSAHYGGSTTHAQSDSNAISVSVSPETSSTKLSVSGYYNPATGYASATPYYGYIYLLDAQPYGNSASASNPNGAATGTITYKSGTTTIGTATLDSSGTAELQTALIPAGANSLTAAFPGDSSFQASTSSAVALTVVPGLTSVSGLTTQPSSNLTTATPVTLSMTLGTNSIGAAPTGTVTFSVNSTTLGTATMTGTAGSWSAYAKGLATLPNITLPKGGVSVMASYSGDSNYAASQGSAVVIVQGVTPGMTLAPTNSTIKQDQALTVTATLTASNGLALPTGTAYFQLIDSYSYVQYTSPSVTVTSGVAAFTIPANTLPLGNFTLSASYNGDNNYYGASTTTPLTVLSAGTVTPTVTVVPPSGTVYYPVNVTVNVTGASGTPTGTVTLTSGTLVMPNVVLNNGSANFTINYGLQGGANTLTATYLGDATYTQGTGTGTVNVQYTPLITFSPNPLTGAVDQPLNVTVAVQNTGNTVQATGTVTLTSGSYSSSATALTNGTATITIPANTFTVGTNTITATYSGDSNIGAGTQTVNINVTSGEPTSFTISADAVSISSTGSGLSEPLTVTPTGGYTGTVQLSVTLTSSPSGAAHLPTATITPSSFSVGGTVPTSTTINFTITPWTSTARLNPFRPLWLGGGTALACLLLFGIPARRRALRRYLSLVLLFAVMAAGVASCGGGGSGGGTSSTGTTRGTYVFTVTGTGNPAVTPAPTTTVTVTVQ